MAITVTSSLAFRQLLKRVATRTGLDRPAPLTDGLTPQALAFHAATLALDGPVLIVVPSDTDAESTAADARTFLAVLAGLTEREAQASVLAFPSIEVDPYRGLQPHLAVSSARAAALHALASRTARLVVASARALVPRVSDPARMSAAGLTLFPGLEIAPHDLAAHFVTAGFSSEDPVDEHGEFCVRGGVVDVFPVAEADPVRLEFIGDVIESIRRYDAATQRSLKAVDRIHISPQREPLDHEGAGDTSDGHDRSSTIIDYVRGAGATVLVFERDEVLSRVDSLEQQWRLSAEDRRASGAPPYQALALGLADLDGWISSSHQVTQIAVDDVAARRVACRPTREYHGRLAEWVAEIREARQRGETIVFMAATGGRAERTVEILADYEIRARAIGSNEDLASASVLVATSPLSKGFHLPDGQFLLFAETDLFEEERRVQERRRSAGRAFLADFRDLKTGDLVVHVDNGIGRFVGLKKLSIGPGQPVQEFMELRYAGEDKLFVPLERLDLVQKYTGGSAPSLDRLGGTTWEKAKTRVKKAMRDMADELLKLYAARRAVTGYAFSPDSHWQQEFADAFPYDLTADQANAIADITRDMESSMPMDRLLCGDVGYGKTEVAMRAAFKAAIDGKQVAVLAPTTVLAFQHLRTLRERFAGFPIKIDMISRFRNRQEQKVILDDLAAGRLDIVVGTHRLLSKDVGFRDLGLLIVDEEQRFGVAHKERIKQLRKRVDVLTMTATPIPRTLNMSLVGIRDMSVIETPPRDRLAIQTHVLKFDSAAITRAIRTELDRSGQVYFVHNRVESIFSMANLVTKLVPDARVAVGHGQMGEDALERVMLGFVSHQFDVLVATTIVENGLDIPNANTIIINRADRYGLAQLYQLRGRVGRADRPAYAYLLVPPDESLSPIAKRRLAAIREFSDLGSGFRVAALDLEIRGAGNLLGGEQSGQIEAVGFDMYTQLLDQTIRELKGEDLEDERRASVNLRIDLRVDESYISDTNQRLTIYRRLAMVRTLPEVDAVLDEVRDRYGPPPASVSNLTDYARTRVIADAIGVESIDREGSVVAIRFRQDAAVDPTVLAKLLQSRGDLTFLPPAVLKIDLGKPTSTQRASKERRGGSRQQSMGSEQSWWIARASAAVAPGFTREALTAEVPPDSTATRDLYERVTGVLTELSRSTIAS